MRSKSNNSDKQAREIDFSQIAFPSDALTIGRLRNVSGDTSAVLELMSASVGEHEFLDRIKIMLKLERIFAREAFQGNRRWDRLKAISHLNDQYERFGLSGGRFETIELIGLIESAACRQRSQEATHAIPDRR